MIATQDIVIDEFVELMRNHYKERLSKIILYGSYARGDYREDSDIDFLVILRDDNISLKIELQSYYQAIKTLSGQQGIDIQAIPYSNKEYDTSTRYFVQQVKKDGILIYEQ